MKRRAWLVFSLVVALALAAGGQQAFAKKNQSSFSSGGRTSSTASRAKASGWSNSSSPASAPSSSSPPQPRVSPASGWSNTASPAKTSDAPTAGWGNGSTPAKTAAQPGASDKPSSPGGSWSNAAGTSASSRTDSGRSKSSFAASGQTSIQKEASLKAYNEYKGRFAKPENPVGTTGSTSSAPQPARTWDNYREYQSYRDTYYSGRGWTAPGYAYQSFPSFGLWDAMFLWFMLRQASGPSFMYNHQNDPGVQAFRQEADKLAATNADLKQQIADLDAKIEKMKKDGVAVEPGRMPEGIDPAVALAAEKVVREAPSGKGRGGGSWLWIIGAGLAVAAIFLLLTRPWGKNAGR